MVCSHRSLKFNHFHFICVYRLGFPIFWFNCKTISAAAKHCARSLAAESHWMSALIYICRSNFFRLSIFIFFFQRCGNDNKNMLTFQILFVVGVLFILLQAVVSFYLNNIGPKNLISKNRSRRHLVRKCSRFHPFFFFFQRFG